MNSGDIALVNYGELPVTWHTRLLMSHVALDSWIIVTPDLDVYEEQMSLANGDFTDFRFLGAHGMIPPDIPAASVYGFQPLDPMELARLRVQADALAIGARAAHPVPPHVAPPPLAVPVPPPPPGMLVPQPPAVAALAPPVQVQVGAADTWVACEDGDAI